MKRKIIKRIPADHSPESIKDVITIVILGENRGLGMVDITTVHLEGTIEEKLQQYKAATGDDWKGFNEQVISEIEHGPTMSLGLGELPPVKHVCRADVVAQEKIDALVKEARAAIEENEKAKKKRVTKKEVEALSIN